jgi:hypothetical protein
MLQLIRWKNIEKKKFFKKFQVIFATRCEYFRKMFLSGLKEAQQEVIEISGDISANVFIAIREFIVKIAKIVPPFKKKNSTQMMLL